jgi:murein DD-endopeptidase MepM/ murein hydrolase activator NlpD
MAVPQAVTAVVSTGAHKPILRIVGASAAALFGAFLVSVPLLLSLLTAPLGVASSTGDRPLVVGDWGGPEAGYSVTAGFGRVDRSDCSICSSFHRGVDLSAGCRSPVFAAGPGTVLSAGWDTTGYGNQVTIDHGGGLTSTYGHMPDGGVMVAAGTVVKAGDQIGMEGSTGRSTGCHVHFEIRLDGQSIDPLAFMRARGITL